MVFICVWGCVRVWRYVGSVWGVWVWGCVRVYLGGKGVCGVYKGVWWCYVLTIKIGSYQNTNILLVSRIDNWNRVCMLSSYGNACDTELRWNWIGRAKGFVATHFFLMHSSMDIFNLHSSRVVEDSMPSRRRILRCTNFGIGASWPDIFLDMVNLHLIVFKAWWISSESMFYCSIILFIWKRILTSRKETAW